MPCSIAPSGADPRGVKRGASPRARTPPAKPSYIFFSALLSGVLADVYEMCEKLRGSFEEEGSFGSNKAAHKGQLAGNLGRNMV